jgi:hypothetical protein
MYFIKIPVFVLRSKDTSKFSTQQQKSFESGKRAVFERAKLFFFNHELRARSARFEGRSG